LVEDPARNPEPLAVLFLLGEHGRTGEPDPLLAALQRETALLAALGAPAPGLGLAVLRTVLAGASVGVQDAQELVAPLVARAVHRAQTLPVGSAAQSQAAELELLLAVRPLLPDDRPTQQRLLRLVRGVGATLGSGLPGRLLTPPAVAEHAHLVAVARMLPEDGMPVVTRSWGGSPILLVQRWTLEVLDRLSGAEVGPAAAWLALMQPHA
jgi:hypothetical protein